MPETQVTNRNTVTLVGRFAGKNYEFPPGEPVSIPEKAAEHIFGLAETNKTGALNRLGLLMPGGSLKEALKALDNVRFSQGRMVFDDAESLPPSHGIGENPDALRTPGGESEAGGISSATETLKRGPGRPRKYPDGG